MSKIFMLKAAPSWESDKIVLRASQLLEELKCLVKEEENDPSQSFQVKKIHTDNLQNALMLRAKLKRLLCQRYFLHLKIEHTKLCSDDSLLFKEGCNAIESEKKKHNRLPKFGFSHLPEKYVIDVVNLNILSEKLYKGSYKWHATDGNFQNIVSLTDSISNCRLLQLRCHFEDIRKQLHCPLFSLVSTYLTIYIECFCCFDPASVSPGLISSIYKSCDTFNKYLRKEGNFTFHRSCCSNSINLCSYDNFHIKIDSKITLNFLSQFEASLAAIKIVNALVTATNKVMRESNKQYQINWIPIEVIGNKITEGDTSDYLSASLSETDLFCESKNTKLKEKTIAKVDKNIISAIESVLTKNQALLLRYLIIDNDKESENSSDSGSSDGVSGHFHACKDSTPLVLESSEDERRYWKQFWKKTDASISKLFLDIPMHNYRDPLPGTVSVWTEDFAAVLMKVLKAASECEDISMEGQLCLRNMLFQIFSFTSFIVWDKSFCTVISTTNKSYCSSVPMENGKFGTKPGYLFYSALKPLLAVFFLEQRSFFAENHIYKSIHGLMAMLDCFQSWVNTRQKSLLSSLDFSTSLIIGYCDVRHISGLLKSITNTNWACNVEENLSTSSVRLFTWRKFMDKMNEVMDLNKDLPYLIQQRVESMMRARLSLIGRSFCTCKRLAFRSNADIESFEEMLEFALKPIYETSLKLQHSGYENWTAFEGSVLVVGKSYLNFINNKLTTCPKISSSELDILCREITQFTVCLEGFEVMHPDDHTLSSISKENITLMIKSLDSVKQLRGRRGIRSNKVTPV